MRKKICNRCGRIIKDGDICCAPPRKTISNRQKDSDKMLRTVKWSKTRKSVLERDKYMCQRCLIKFDIINTEDLTVHHIKSRKEYPELFYELTNLVCLCRTCNLQLEREDLNHQLDFEFNTRDEEYEILL